MLNLDIITHLHNEVIFVKVMNLIMSDTPCKHRHMMHIWFPDHGLHSCFYIMMLKFTFYVLIEYCCEIVMVLMTLLMNYFRFFYHYIEKTGHVIFLFGWSSNEILD